MALSLRSQTPPEHKETVVVTGTWQPLILDETDRSVNAYPVRDRAVSFNSLADVIGQDSSVYVQSRGANGTQVDFSIRGASFEQTLMLLNGIRINDEQSAHYNSDFAIPLDDVDHVEVLRGAGSTLYGSDATGGVINFVTHPAADTKPLDLTVRADGGSFGTTEQSGFLGVLKGPVSERISFEREQASGFIDNREYRNLALSSDSWLHSPLGLTRVFLGLDDRPFGADLFYGNFNSWERTKTWVATLSQDLGDKTLFALGYRRHTDLFELLRDNPDFYTNRHIDDGWDLAIRRHDPIARWATVSYGGELTADHVQSNNLGVHGRKQGAVYGAFDARSLRRASITVGAREEFYGARQTILVPNVSGGYWLSSRVKLRASASRAFRLPSYTDLYYSDPANLGNANLKPERAAEFEGGLDWHPHEKWKLSATVFNRRERDDIDYVRANSSSIWQAMNFDRLNFVGGEATVSVSLPERQELTAGYTVLHGAASTLNGYQSKYVFNYPTQQAIATWQMLSPHGWLARVRAGETDQYQRQAYFLLDASLGWTRSRFHPYLRTSNLTDTSYQPVYGVPMPGRSFVGGLEIAARPSSKR
jgi:iron complex outermembrane recepter protein